MNTDNQAMKQIVSQDTDILRSLESTSKEIGFNLEDEVIKLGLPPNLLSNPDLFVPSQLFNSLLENIAQNLHCHDLGIRMAKHLNSSHLGLPGRMMLLCETFKQALDKATHYSAFYRDTGPWQYCIDNDNVSIFKTHDYNGEQHYQQRSVFGTAQMYKLITTLSANQWKPTSVSFSHKDPGARFTETYKAFFNCDILFDQTFDGVSFDADHLNDDIISADKELLFNIEQHIEGLNKEVLNDNDFLSHVRQIISQRLNFSNCSLAEIADSLSLTSDDFSERLQQRTMSFKTLLEEQICEKANIYLTQFNAPTELVLSTLMPGNEARLNELLMNKIADQPQW